MCYEFKEELKKNISHKNMRDDVYKCCKPKKDENHT